MSFSVSYRKGLIFNAFVWSSCMQFTRTLILATAAPRSSSWGSMWTDHRTRLAMRMMRRRQESPHPTARYRAWVGKGARGSWILCQGPMSMRPRGPPLGASVTRRKGETWERSSGCRGISRLFLRRPSGNTIPSTRLVIQRPFYSDQRFSAETNPVGRKTRSSLFMSCADRFLLVPAIVFSKPVWFCYNFDSCDAEAEVGFS